MKSISAPFIVGAWCVLGVLASATPVFAYPPAPHHTLYGMVRTQFGDPVAVSSSVVFLETPAGVVLHSSIENASTEPGVNYRLEVPMDSGTSGEAESYLPTALRPYFEYRLKVVIGSTVYLPIEMAGNFAQIGQPGEKTRIDLTLGVDSDGDGLPDAWEQALIAMFGGTLEDINPGDDTDGDGIRNIDEYLAGTYAFDPSDGFRLTLAGLDAGVSTLELMAVNGRTYGIQASADLKDWKTVPFRIRQPSLETALRESYSSTSVQLLRVEVPQEEGATHRFFRALVQ